MMEGLLTTISAGNIFCGHNIYVENSNATQLHSAITNKSIGQSSECLFHPSN